MDTASMLAEIGFDMTPKTIGTLVSVHMTEKLKITDPVVSEEIDKALKDDSAGDGGLLMDRFKRGEETDARKFVVIVIGTKGMDPTTVETCVHARLHTAVKAIVNRRGAEPRKPTVTGQVSMHVPPTFKAESQPKCSDCGLPQRSTPSGMVCENGHGGADPMPEAPVAEVIAPLDPDQEAALQGILATEENCVLIGPAGSGKSHVIKELCRRTKVLICATTGRAALNVGGCTIDKVFCFKRDTWEVWNHSFLEKQMAEVADRIVIDESSMIGAAMGNLIARIAKMYGKQLILVGDWAQAAPVKDGWGTQTTLIQQAKIFRLTKIHRQADPVFLGGLNKLRSGIVDDEVRNVFMPRVVAMPPADDAFIRLFATNNASDVYNNQRLAAVNPTGIVFTLQARFTDTREDLYERRKKPFEDFYQKKQMEESRFAHMENFKIGARIVLTMNEPNGEYVNGDTGVIVNAQLYDGTWVKDIVYNPWTSAAIDPMQIRCIHVKLDRVANEIVVNRLQQGQTTPSGKPMYAIAGFAIRLGWAITIHRAQGMTVDKAYLDMSTILAMPHDGRHGLAYVGLSRTRTIEGLQIGNWSDQAVVCADDVKHFI